MDVHQVRAAAREQHHADAKAKAKRKRNKPAPKDAQAAAPSPQRIPKKAKPDEPEPAGAPAGASDGAPDGVPDGAPAGDGAVEKPGVKSSKRTPDQIKAIWKEKETKGCNIVWSWN